MQTYQRWLQRLSTGGAALHVLPLLLLLWFAMAGGSAWAFGVPAALAAALIGRWLAPLDIGRLSLTGALRFAAFFVYRSVLGGLDVTWRVFHLRMPLAIHDVLVPLDLATSQQRTVFIGTLSLLPGTLSCDVVDGRLRVHSIAGDPERELDRLAVRVRDLFHHRDRDGDHDADRDRDAVAGP